MPGLTAYQRFVISGTGPGSEIWQTGFSTIATTAITSQAGLQSAVNSVAPFVNTFWTSLKPNLYPLYSIKALTAYQYVYPSNHAQYQAQATLTVSTGTQAVNAAPVDTCLVVSLRTAVPGRRTRGRMYIPCHAPAQTTDGCISSTVSTAIGTAVKTMLASVFTSTSLAPVVVSRTGGTYETITGQVTDNKPDVQRRRENRLAATNVQVLTIP